jgi:uncharacterized protein YndB with AHSA1/START domain
MNTQHKTIVLERLANAPIDLVWKSLTDTYLLKKWLPIFPDFKPEVGFATQFSLGPDKQHQYVHMCEVIEAVKNKKLTYTWHYKGYPGNSYVTYKIENIHGQTKIILTHVITEPFPAEENFSDNNFREGWTYIANNLKKFTEKYTLT